MRNRWTWYIKGYLTIRLYGDYVERFLNMCRMHDIFLWDIKKEEKDFYCSISAIDYFDTVPLLKKTGTRASVIKKNGIPFYVPFMKKRVLFFISLFLCLGMLYVVTDYIWAIEFVGNIQISNEELGDFLDEERVYYGMKKETLDCEEMEKRLRESFPNITWTSIYFEGTKLYVEVKENEKKEPVVEEMQGTDLIAQESGTIMSIITRNGVPKVKIGDVVEVGQVLVEGNVPIYDESQNIVAYQTYNSDADVMIQTQMSYCQQLEKTYPFISYTGSEHKGIFLDVFGYHIESPMLGRDFQECERITQKYQVCLLEDLYLPIYYGNICEKEYHLQYLEYSEEEMKNLLNDNLEKFILCLQEKGVQIIEKNVKIKKYNKGMELNAKLSVIKPTGEEVKITENIPGTDEKE